MPNSSADKPRPPDDDESIDLAHPDSVEEGSALSFSGKASDGSSGSGIRSWEQLVRESGGDPNAEIVSFDPTAAADEAASDKDLLREVLADEPPPSGIILKDLSKSEIVLPPDPQPKPPNDPAHVVVDLHDDVPTAQPASASGKHPGPKSGPFELPPGLAATRPGDSSILGHMPPVSPGHSGMTSDLWGSSPDIDLFRSGLSADASGESMKRTDRVVGPPLVRPRAGDSQTVLGDSPVGDDESSAVDLGSHPDGPMPFPLGADSMIGSSVRGPDRTGAPEDESGTVDLLTREFDVGLPESNTTPSWVTAREDMPPTVPMVPAGKARLVAWGGGGAAGLLVGVAACAGLWLLGWVPGKATTPAGPTAAELATARMQATDQANHAKQVEKERDDQAAKAAANAAKAAADLKRVNGQLATAKAAANEAKLAKERADALAERLRQADAKQAQLTASLQTATAERTAAAAKARDAEANVARLRDEVAKAGQAAQTARAALDRATAAGKQAALFTAEVAQRLRASPESAATDLLAALDRALARPAGEPVTAAPTRPVVAATGPVQTPQQIHRAEYDGYNALRSGDPANAAREFARLAASPERTATHFYFLGLAQWRQGQYVTAEDSFRRGWELERASRPPSSEVEAAFERLDRGDREVVNRYRR